ncbi:hypothetical protein T190_12220 [Sinorhizobium meliloti CCBAU 01290]|nr:hypothetical protein T190_12220 [Sinorhizobium meliloti CCBAU 01290]
MHVVGFEFNKALMERLYLIIVTCNAITTSPHVVGCTIQVLVEFCPNSDCGETNVLDLRNLVLKRNRSSVDPRRCLTGTTLVDQRNFKPFRKSEMPAVNPAIPPPMIATSAFTLVHSRMGNVIA